MYELETSGIVVQTGKRFGYLGSANSSGETSTICVGALIVQIPADASGAGLVHPRWVPGGSLSIASRLDNRAHMTGFDIEDDRHCLELYEIVVVCIQLLKKDGRPDTGMSPSRLYVPDRPAKPTSCPCH